MADEGNIYESLSREAEALKFRTEATEERMETLQKKLSNSSIDVPVAPPRRSVLNLADTPEINPSAPALCNSTSDTDLIRQLTDVEKMNKDWVIYNDNREIFVHQLTAKHHETTNQLRRAMEEIQRLQQCPAALSIEQRKHYDNTLIQARNELQKTEQANNTLSFQVKSMEAKYLAEQEQRRAAEHEASQLKMTIEHLENINNKLTKTIQKDRRKSDLNSSRLEESLNNLSSQLVHLNASDRSSTRSSPRKYKAPPRPNSPEKILRKNLTQEYSSMIFDSTSPKSIISPISPNTAKSRRSVDTTAISCENCGKSWPVSHHNLLLKHLDECDII